MATEVETDRFYLQKEQIADDSDDEYKYEEVAVEEDFVTDDFEEDLHAAVQTLQEDILDTQAAVQKEELPKASVTQRPEVVDDFVRNFLVKMNMMRTLDTFQTEWYELQQKGELNEEDVGIVPDIYVRNNQLWNELKYTRDELIKYHDAAVKVKDSYVKVRKERDYHRMHHKRVVQEKNKLIGDVKRLKEHYSSYEPTLRQLKTKYESAMKEKMLTKLERDRTVGKVSGLESALKNKESLYSGSANAESGKVVQRGGATMMVDSQGRGPTQQMLAKERSKYNTLDVQAEFNVRHPNDTAFPPDRGVNPYLSQAKVTGHLTQAGGFKLSNTIQAHSHAVSGLSLHPRQAALVTTSDDNLWKLWSIPDGDMIMKGEGHTDWVSDCDFHPLGAQLATTSGDSTVKIWDFKKAECIHTFTEHSHAVWSCSWHSCGDFLATCSLDNTSKIWDLNSIRCRYTLRGHTDSVNSIEFLPFSNTLITSSADKTLSLWDGRTGLCAQTFYGHVHSVNHCTFNLRGDTVASCDSYGVVKMWDVRNCSELASMECGPYPANKVAFDTAGAVLAIASNDAVVKMYELANGKMTTLPGHEDSVQCVLFDKSGEYLVSGGSDLTVRIWS